MGLGDWIMATAQAKRMNEATGRQVVFTNHNGRVFWSPDIFANNPRITKDAQDGDAIVNFPGNRPYIDSKSEQRWTWKHWDIEPGELYLTDLEREAASWVGGMVMIEPHTKTPGGNKSWPFDRWQKVVDAMPGVEFVQVYRPGGKILRGVTAVQTTFREAAAIMSHCRAFVGTEGALHHAAAALGVPAVVLWSEFISPDFTGYPTQMNIRHAGKACGSRMPCHGCRTSMDAITVCEVVSALKGLQ
jgi:ADP-heptose:LPS heptosyltransferase